MVPSLLGKSCSFPLVSMWVWWNLSCLEHYRTHQGCGTPNSELGLEGDPVPFLVPAPLSQFWLFHTHLPFLSVCLWPEADTIFLMTPWSEMCQKRHIFEPYCQQICLLMEKKRSLFRLFCFLPRQESSFCLCPLAQGPKWLLQHKKPISTNKNYFFGSAVYWHLNYNVVTFFFCNRCLTQCIDAVDGCLFLRLLSAEEIKWT